MTAPSERRRNARCDLRNLGEPLSKVVLYENQQSVFTPATSDVVTQTIRGFYKHAGDVGKLTHIVGGGGNNQTERLYFNGNLIPLANAFPQTSPSSDRSWSFPTVLRPMAGTTIDPGYGETVTAKVDHQNSAPADCLAWAAMVQVPVLDDDHDGCRTQWRRAARPMPAASGRIRTADCSPTFIRWRHHRTNGTYSSKWRDENGRPRGLRVERSSVQQCGEPGGAIGHRAAA